jgi:uncharacterized membrane protein
MFDVVFPALFNYRLPVFEAGDFRFDLSWGSFVAAAIVAVIASVAVMTYRRVRVNEGRRRDRIVLTSLRIAALAIVLFCLFRPTLVVRAAVPQQNVVAVLIDCSRSMLIPDLDGKPRADYIRSQFGEPGSPLMKSLSDRFLVRFFCFSSVATRTQDVKGLTFTGPQTRLGAALDGVREELAGLPVAGIVLLSDGADTSEDAIDTTLLGIKSQKIPVFAVGVGSEKLPRDIQVDRVSTPHEVLKNAALFVDVVVRHSGFGGQTVSVDVEDQGAIVGTQQVQLPSDGNPVTVRVRATAGITGPRLFKFRVAPQRGEVVIENNSREAMIQVRDGREKILYYEGEPRWEMRFLRRAIADDKNLEVVALQRTADNKFMRLFVNEPESPNELTPDFPTTREELFKYRGLILGSVEAAAFTGDQIQMIADFVDKRGGGLLMLGGARSFAEGGWGGTPVADALPLIIDRRKEASDYFARMTVAPTPAGREHAVTQIADTEAASLARWPKLPPVTSINAPLQIKPGATQLLAGNDERNRPYPVLSWQKFGRGKTIAFPVQDTLTWQMHASIAVEDQTHERFWAQMIRYLVEGVPGPVSVRPTTDRVEPGENVTIEASVVDPTYTDINNANVVAHVTSPTGGSQAVQLQWTGDRDGRYRGSFVTKDAGHYAVTVDADQAGKPVGTSGAYVRAAAGESEYFDPTLHPATLRRVAEETGGRYYTPATVSAIAEDVRIAGRGVTSVEERPLWNMPILLIALMLLICAEWGYRRAVGLA